MIRVDANYIIRYFVNDNEKMAEIAEETLMNEEVFISHEVLAEVIYVLGGIYEIPKREISLKLITLLSQGNVNSLDGVAIEALMIFVDKNIDFVDALLCAYSKNDEVRTFDKKLLKCIANR
jgi:predicted nucleic-acid-binding protein